MHNSSEISGELFPLILRTIQALFCSCIVILESSGRCWGVTTLASTISKATNVEVMKAVIV